MNSQVEAHIDTTTALHFILFCLLFAVCLYSFAVTEGIVSALDEDLQRTGCKPPTSQRCDQLLSLCPAVCRLMLCTACGQLMVAQGIMEKMSVTLSNLVHM